MIEIKNVSKTYNNHKVVNNVTITLPNKGLVLISGPSGCGKTTLFNAIASLINFDGEIKIDGKNISKLNDDEKSLFRLRNIGFIFQDFKLYENETILNNILLPFDLINKSKNSIRMRKVRDLLKLVNLENLKEKNVKNLSGGEKQRIAICRALINEPKIILADEPTGSLDNKNSKEIMEILKAISKNSLVIVISHDYELSSSYADMILSMKDGLLIDITKKKKSSTNSILPLANYKSVSKAAKIPYSFLIKHSLHSIKEKKFRTLICNLVTSLGLIGVGVATILSSTIGDNIKSAYASIIDTNKIMISSKNKVEEDIVSTSYDEAFSILNNNKEYIYDIGITYYANFEEMFPDINHVYLDIEGSFSIIRDFTIRYINEFQWLDLNKDEVYPTLPTYLDNDEVVLGLTFDTIEEICFSLKIPRTVEALSNLLENNNFDIVFNCYNSLWNYEVNLPLSVKGFILSRSNSIYHFNHLWNEDFFENSMQLLTSNNLSKVDKYPWTLKKMYYFEFYENEKENFLRNTYFSHEFDKYKFEIVPKEFYPITYKNLSSEKINKVIILDSKITNLKPSLNNYFLFASNDIFNPIFGSGHGYSIFPENLMMGFSNEAYFSLSKNLIEDTIDALSLYTSVASESISLTKGIAVGHYSKSIQDGVTFENIRKVDIGRKPKTLSEIVISKGLMKKIFANEECINEYLYSAFTISEKYLSSGKIMKEFATCKLKIVGIVDSSKISIYHDPDWSISFFQCKLGVSIFDLEVNTISYNLKENADAEKVIKKLKRAFPQFEIINPLSDINKSVDEICKYLQIALIAFSSIATIISILLLTITNFLHANDQKKDIGLARCIGANKKEAMKFIIMHSVLMCFISFVMSCFELFSIAFTINKVINNIFMTSTFSLNPSAFLYMFLLSFIISIFSSYFVAKRETKIPPLEALKN